MNKLTRTNLINKLASFLGIAGVSSLISLPGLAEINPQAHLSNPSTSTSFELAETPATDNYGPRSNPNDPTKTNAPSAGSSYPENYPSGGTRPSSDASESSTPNAPSSDANNSSTTNAPSSDANNSSTTNAPSSNPNNSSTTNAPSSNPNDPTKTNAPSAGSSYPSNYPSGGSRDSTTGNSQSSVSSQDKNFVNQAAQINMAEIQLGQLALQRGSSNAVKQYAQRMINEHTQASQQLMQLARQKGITPPTSLDSQHKAMMDRLSKLSGTSFDEAYMKEMVNGHNQAISLFQTESQQGKDADLKAWASGLIPNLQAHLQMANQNAAKR